jgi:hypothetical protein
MNRQNRFVNGGMQRKGYRDCQVAPSLMIEFGCTSNTEQTQIARFDAGLGNLIG